MAPPNIRPMWTGDLPAALQIQDECYPAHLTEGLEAFASRLRLRDSYCLVAEADGAVIAYLLAHGWPAQSPPPLGACLSDDARVRDILYIHDLSVSAAGRGYNLGRKIVDHVLAMAAANDIARAELIAVEGASAYWRKLGFIEAACSADLAAKVASYGADARWMARDIPPS